MDKFCPYCEKENAAAFKTNRQWFVSCLECGARGPIALTAQEAWDKWNTRPGECAEPTPPAEEAHA